MTSPADATIHALRSIHDGLVAVVADLDSAALNGPSAASEWTISQVLSHLGSGAEISLGTLRRALEPEVEQVPNTEIWDRWNAMSPEDHLRGFLVSDETLVAAYEALDDTTRRELRIDLGFLPEPVDLALATRFRLNEAALHAWDVEWVLDRTATVSAEATPLLLDHIAMMLGSIGHADAVAGDVTLAVVTTQPDTRFGLRIADKVSIVSTVDAAERPDGTLTLPAEAWLRLAAGRLAPDQTPTSVTLDSARLTLDDLRRVFPGL